MNLHREVPKWLSAFTAVMLCAALLAVHANAQTSPLPSWNDGSAKQAIFSFVNK